MSMPPESCFQPEHNNLKQSIILQDATIPKKAKDELSSLLVGDYDGIDSKSQMDVGTTNLFQIDIPTMGPPIAHKTIPNSGKVSKVC